MAKNYVVNEVWNGSELLGRYNNTLGGYGDAVSHLNRIKDKYGDDGKMLIKRNYCTLSELKDLLEIDGYFSGNSYLV